MHFLRFVVQKLYEQKFLKAQRNVYYEAQKTAKIIILATTTLFNELLITYIS